MVDDLARSVDATYAAEDLAGDCKARGITHGESINAYFAVIARTD